MVVYNVLTVQIQTASHLAIVQGLTWLGGGPLLLPDVQHARGVHLDGGPGRHPPRLLQQRRELGVELGQVLGGAGQLSVVHQQHHPQSPGSRVTGRCLGCWTGLTDGDRRRAIIICVVTCSDASSGVTSPATWQQYGARDCCEVYVISRSSRVMSSVTRDVTPGSGQETNLRDILISDCL